MKLPDHLVRPSPRLLRQFGSALAAFGLGAADLTFRKHGAAGTELIFLAVAAVGAFAAWLRPALLRPAYVVAATASWPLGLVMSFVTLAILFYAVITPVALVFRLVGRDRLKRRRSSGVSSHWRPVQPRTDLRDYQRPF